ANGPQVALAAAGPASATLYTNPSNSGKRVKVQFTVWSSGASTYNSYKTNGSVNCWNNVGTAVNSANPTATGQAMYLDPGENYAVTVTAGSITFFYSAMSFDASNPLKQPCLYGATSGANTIYAVPANTTAMMMGRTTNPNVYLDAQTAGVMSDIGDTV